MTATAPHLLIGDLAGATRRSPFNRCEWCGHPCYGRSCNGHRDLTEIQHIQQSPPHHLAMESTAGSDNTGG